LGAAGIGRRKPPELKSAAEDTTNAAHATGFRLILVNSPLMIMGTINQRTTVTHALGAHANPVNTRYLRFEDSFDSKCQSAGNHRAFPFTGQPETRDQVAISGLALSNYFILTFEILRRLGHIVDFPWRISVTRPLPYQSMHPAIPYLSSKPVL
jgi:hypothetical protein